jgi:hypothetical protein
MTPKPAAVPRDPIATHNVSDMVDDFRTVRTDSANLLVSGGD